jgi:hypothetical protein
MAELTDTDLLQHAYNGMCGAIWNLDKVRGETHSDALDAIFTDLKAIRSRLAVIAFPNAHIDGSQ